jgi:hypothetical protein
MAPLIGKNTAFYKLQWILNGTQDVISTTYSRTFANDWRVM